MVRRFDEFDERDREALEWLRDMAWSYEEERKIVERLAEMVEAGETVSATPPPEPRRPMPPWRAAVRAWVAAHSLRAARELRGAA